MIGCGFSQIFFSTSNSNTLKGWGWILASGILDVALGTFLFASPVLTMEIAAEMARIKSAVTEDKTRIRQKIDRLKQKRRQRIAELKESQKSRKKSRLTNKINKQEEKTAQLQSKLDKLG